MKASQPARILIAHVDLDAFFASCEQRDHPDYRGKPVIVGALPGGRGVVAAASYEARVYGVHSAMPIGEAARRCPNAVFVRPAMQRYAAESARIMNLLENISPYVEKASIDEAYLDISGLERTHGSPENIGHAIKTLISGHTGLTASVGIGPNRLIAKLGSEYRKPDGLTVIEPGGVQDFLDPMPVGNLRGVGPQTLKRFRRLGITTVAELRYADRRRLEQSLGKRAAQSFLRQAQGIASSEIVTNRQRKSISKERTFGQDIRQRADLRTPLLELARSVAASARRYGLSGRVIKLKIRFHDFTTLTRQRTLPDTTNDERVLFDHAWQLLDHADMPAAPVRLIGIGLSDWSMPAAKQDDLFAEPPRRGDQELLNTIDAVASRFGDGKLQIGLRRK